MINQTKKHNYIHTSERPRTLDLLTDIIVYHQIFAKYLTFAEHFKVYFKSHCKTLVRILRNHAKLQICLFFL